MADDLTGILTPELFADAIASVSRRAPVGSGLDSAGWQRQPDEIRDASFWSAGVTNMKLLSKMQNLLLDYLNKNTTTAPDGLPMLKVGSRSDFVKQISQFIQDEGIPREGQRGSLQDIGSSRRLRLIFDTNISISQGFGYYQQGQNPAILKAFPFQIFIRVAAVKEPRPVHEANRNVIRRKDDLAFWLAMNSPSFGGFGKPYSPWGYNSQMGTQDIAADDPRVKNLQPQKTPAPNKDSFADKIKTPTTSISPDLIQKLRDALASVGMKATVTQGRDELKLNQPGGKATASPDKPETPKAGETPKAKPANHPLSPAPVTPAQIPGETPKAKQMPVFPASTDALKPLKDLPNGDTLYTDADTGRLFSADPNYDANHATAIFLGSLAFAAAGLNTPQTMLYYQAASPEKIAVSLYEPGEMLGGYLDSATQLQLNDIIADAQAGFIFDALFSNLEVNETSFVNADGQVVRQSNGIFGFTTWGDVRPFDGDVQDDLEVLRKLQIYSGLTDEQIYQQIQNALNRSAAILAVLSGDIKQTVSERFDALASILQNKSL